MDNTANAAVMDVFRIGAMLVSVVFVAMLVKNAQPAGQLVTSVSNAFGGLMRSATLSDTNAATSSNLTGMIYG